MLRFTIQAFSVQSLEDVETSWGAERNSLNPGGLRFRNDGSGRPQILDLASITTRQFALG